VFIKNDSRKRGFLKPVSNATIFVLGQWLGFVSAMACSANEPSNRYHATRLQFNASWKTGLFRAPTRFVVTFDLQAGVCFRHVFLMALLRLFCCVVFLKTYQCCWVVFCALRDRVEVVAGERVGEKHLSA